MTDDFAAAWRAWHDRRVERVAAPHGALSLTGTHWLAAGENTVDGVPGTWRLTDGGVELTAKAADHLLVDDEPVDGVVGLRSDASDEPSELAHYARKLVLIDREGELGVRVFDPDAPARREFAGISASPPDPAWRLPARFSAYPEAEIVPVPNADGRERGLELVGEISFAYAGATHTLRVSGDADGLSATFRDATSGPETFGFRFVELPTAVDGETTLDLNRAYLPPCAFADHFVCPLPPPGNTLPFPVEAGELAVLLG